MRKSGCKMKEMTAALIIKERKLLLVHNTKHNGLRIEPPGGKKENNESMEACVIRETKEELDIEILPVNLFGIYETYTPEGDFKVYMYLSKIKNGEIKLMEPEKISAFGWYNIKEIEDFKKQGYLVPNLSSAIEELRKLLN